MRMEEFDIKNENLEFDETAPARSNVTVEQLNKFLKKDDTLIFYGGEPLLEMQKIQEIMDFFGDKLHYRIQTNGLLLDRLPLQYLHKIRKILVSLDGNQQRTNYNRGNGIYERVIQNLAKLREENYNGEIVARMTIAQEFPDVYEAVMNIIKLIDEGLIDSVHWQLDAGFYKSDFKENKFRRFITHYNESITKLINWWTAKMQEGKVYKIYPFIGITESLLKNEKTLMRCGAGYEGFAITTNGMISACPVTNGVKTFYVGDLNTPEKIKDMKVQGECLKCSYLNLCGGRCLYQNYAQLWPKIGNALICTSVRYLIDAVKEKQLIMQKLMDSKVISLCDFAYEKYFGPEIIP